MAKPAPASPLNLVPITDLVRDGACHIVTGDGQFAVARWSGQGWVFPASSARPIGFDPTHFHAVRRDGQ